MASIYASNSHFSLQTTNTWRKLSDYKISKKPKIERSALKELITFKCKDAHKLEEVKFKWTGEKIHNMAVSLYKKHKEKDKLVPLEKNIVSDGTWNEENQEVTFNTDEKLVATNKYYLVLSYPPEMESKVKTGKFLPSEKDAFKVALLR